MNKKSFKVEPPPISSERKKELQHFEKQMGIRFRSLGLLNLAFSHRSYANEFDGQIGNIITIASDEFACHRCHGNLLQHILIRGVNGDGDLVEKLQRLLLGVPIAVYDYRWMDLLVHQIYSLPEKLTS